LSAGVVACLLSSHAPPISILFEAPESSVPAQGTALGNDCDALGLNINNRPGRSPDVLTYFVALF